jgi:hypothetical protein
VKKQCEDDRRTKPKGPTRSNRDYSSKETDGAVLSCKGRRRWALGPGHWAGIEHRVEFELEAEVGGKLEGFSGSWSAHPVLARRINCLCRAVSMCSACCTGLKVGCRLSASTRVGEGFAGLATALHNYPEVYPTDEYPSAEFCAGVL